VLALAAGVFGPLAEIPLMLAGAWHYLTPDYFPLDALASLFSEGLVVDDPSSSGLASITGPCYFAVTTDAIALGRCFGVPHTNSSSSS